jgi:hypothetical protein
VRSSNGLKLVILALAIALFLALFSAWRESD